MKGGRRAERAGVQRGRIDAPFQRSRRAAGFRSGPLPSLKFRGRSRLIAAEADCASAQEPRPSARKGNDQAGQQLDGRLAQVGHRQEFGPSVCGTVTSTPTPVGVPPCEVSAATLIEGWKVSFSQPVMPDCRFTLPLSPM